MSNHPGELGRQRIKRRPVVLHLLVGLGCASAMVQPGWAASLRWQSIGPYGGNVRKLVRCADDPAVIYALLFGGGVDRSGDGGATWRDANAELPAASYADLDVDPGDPDSAWVIDNSGPGPSLLYHTRDGGRHWRALGAPEGSFLLAAARDGVLYTGGNAGVFRSVDLGRSWKSLTAGLDPTAAALSIAVDAAKPNLLYAVIRGLSATGVFVTADGGRSWRRRRCFRWTAAADALCRAGRAVPLALDLVAQPRRRLDL